LDESSSLATDCTVDMKYSAAPSSNPTSSTAAQPASTGKGPVHSAEIAQP
jgi:hypothetical protein